MAKLGLVSEVGLPVDWVAFWDLFRTYADWTLQRFDGSTWVNTTGLTITRTFPSPNKCKFKLIFNAADGGNYRLTFLLNRAVAGYVERTGDAQCEMSYESFIVTFDWSDIKDLSGIQLSRGITDSYFWFRIRRDNIPKGAQVEIDPSTVSTSTSSSATTYGNQRKCFYANGRFWVFYSDGSNLVYRTSTDGTNWSSATTLFSMTLGHLFDVFFDGTYLHYVRSPWGTSLYYRRGTPNSDGTITWSAAEQVCGTQPNAEYFYPSIGVDSNGYAFVAYKRYDGTNHRPYVNKNANNDGTWANASGFPVEMSTTSSSVWRSGIARLTNGRMYICYSSGWSAIRGRLYDGSLGNEESASSTSITTAYYFSVVGQGDNVHLVFHGSGNNILHRIRTYGTGWGNETTVRASVSSSSNPVLTINATNGDLYCFWCGSPTTDHIYYKRYTGGTWDTDPTDWINESTEHLTTNDKHTCFYQVNSNYLGLVYMTLTSSPYNVRFAYLSISGVTLVEVADSFGSSDGVLAHKTFATPDSIMLSEAAPLADRTLPISDSLGLSEAVVMDKTLLVADAIELSDLIPLTNKTIVLVDTISLSETVALVSTLLDLGYNIRIWMDAYKVFTGLVEENTPLEGKVTHLSGRDLGQKLLLRTKSKSWDGIEVSLAAKDLVEDLTEVTTYQVETPSPPVAITRDLKYEYITDGLRDLAKQAGGDWEVKLGMGHDLRFRSRSSTNVPTSPASIQEGINVLRGVQKETDALRLFNKVTVIGGPRNNLGNDPDQYTDQDASSWVDDNMYILIIDDYSTFVAGKASIKRFSDPLDLNPVLSTNYDLGSDGVDFSYFTRVSFAYKTSSMITSKQYDFLIRLIDTSNRVAHYKYLDTSQSLPTTWVNYDIALNSFTAEQGFDWTHIRYVQFRAVASSPPDGTISGYDWWDRLCLYTPNVIRTATDSSSDFSHTREHIYRDEKLVDPDFIQEVADALLVVLKNRENRYHIPLSGSPTIAVGGKVTVNIPSYGLVGTYYACEATHRVSPRDGYLTEVVLETPSLTLEALLAQSIQRQIKRLERSGIT